MIDDYTYEGTREVVYTEEYIDSDGNTKTRDVSETLRATLKRPGPYYADRISLVYGNHAAPNLIFHRRPPEKGLFNFEVRRFNWQNALQGLERKVKMP